MSTTRIAIWASTTDRVVLPLATVPTANLATPHRWVTDRLGNPVLVKPPDAQRWTASVDLSIPRRHIYRLNEAEAATRRNLLEWLRHYCYDNMTALYIFAESHGRDSSGTAVTVRTYWQGYLELPADLLIPQASRGAMGDIRLTLKIPPVTGREGTFSDFDSLTSVTPRT